MAESHQDVIIEYSKMALEHNDTLLKLVGALIVFNIVLYANLTSPSRKTGAAAEPSPAKRWPSVWLLGSSITGVASIGFGYMANSVVLTHMANWAAEKPAEWVPAEWSETFTGCQIVFLILCLFCFLMILIFNSDAAVEALRKTKLGGSEE